MWVPNPVFHELSVRPELGIDQARNLVREFRVESPQLLVLHEQACPELFVLNETLWELICLNLEKVN